MLIRIVVSLMKLWKVEIVKEKLFGAGNSKSWHSKVSQSSILHLQLQTTKLAYSIAVIICVSIFR